MAGGAPTALNSSRQETILNAIRLGCTERRASSFGGVSHETIKQWRRKGEAALQKPAGKRSPTERKYAEFVTLFDKALSECSVRMQQTIFTLATPNLTDQPMRDVDGSIVRDARGNPVIIPAASNEEKSLALRAAMFWLSNREREDYTTRAEVTGAEGTPLGVSAGDVLSIFRRAVDRSTIQLESADDEID